MSDGELLEGSQPPGESDVDDSPQKSHYLWKEIPLEIMNGSEFLVSTFFFRS